MELAGLPLLIHVRKRVYTGPHSCKIKWLHGTYSLRLDTCVRSATRSQWSIHGTQDYHNFDSRGIINLIHTTTTTTTRTKPPAGVVINSYSGTDHEFALAEANSSDFLRKLDLSPRSDRVLVWWTMSIPWLTSNLGLNSGTISIRGGSSQSC